MARSYGFTPSASYQQQSADMAKRQQMTPQQQWQQNVAKTQALSKPPGSSYGQAQPKQPPSQGTPYGAYTQHSSDTGDFAIYLEAPPSDTGNWSAPPSQPSVGGWPDPPQKTWEQQRLDEIMSQPGFRAPSNNPRLAARLEQQAREQVAREGRARGAANSQQDQSKQEEMQKLWAKYRNMTPEEQRAASLDPDSQAELKALREWRMGPKRNGPTMSPGGPGGTGPIPAPGAAQPEQQPSQGDPYGGLVADLPAGVSRLPWQNDPSKPLPSGWIWERAGSGKSAGWTAVRDTDLDNYRPVSQIDPVYPRATQSPPSQASGGQYGNMPYGQSNYNQMMQTLSQYSPQSQYGQQGQDPLQQAFTQSMNAWQMPKQQLMQWGQQASQMPWGPNYGNTPDSRPSPWSQNIQGQFGNNTTDMWNNIGGFIQGVNNQAAQKPVGVYQGQGNPGAQYGKTTYNIPGLIQQGQQMVQNGWQNPFASQPPMSSTSQRPTPQGQLLAESAWSRLYPGTPYPATPPAPSGMLY